MSSRSRWLHCITLALLTSTLAHPAVASPPKRHPLSCKPELPAFLALRVVEAPPGGTVRFEAVVEAQRPLEDIRLEVELPEGARWVRPAGTQLGAMAQGARRELAMSASLPRRGRSEIHARITFTMPGGERMSRGAYLAFEDGAPARPPAYRQAEWNGTRVLEAPAVGASR